MFVIIKEAATGNVGVPRNFAKFTGKHLCQSLFLIKLQALSLAEVLPCEFWEISKNTFFTEDLRMIASKNSFVYRNMIL